MNQNDVRADDPRVLQLIKDEFLLPPSKEPYNLTNPELKNPSMGQGQRIDFILRGKVSKFFT